MSPHGRTPRDQRRVNAKMRDPKNVEDMLFRARRATPASPDQVREFLTTSPPEFLVLIEAVSARNAGRTPGRNDEFDELARRRLQGDPITAGLVAVLLGFQGHRSCTKPHDPPTTNVVQLFPRRGPAQGSDPNDSGPPPAS